MRSTTDTNVIMPIMTVETTRDMDVNTMSATVIMVMSMPTISMMTPTVSVYCT